MTTIGTSNNTLAKVGHKHEAIMLWLLANPEKKLRECAEHFGVSQVWLSVIIHSKAFQDSFAEHRDEYYSGVADDLGDKLHSLAHLCVDKLADKVEDSEDPVFLAKTATDVLSRLGYGAKTNVTLNAPAGSNVSMTITSPEAIARAEDARRRLRQLKEIQGEVIDNESA